MASTVTGTPFNRALPGAGESSSTFSGTVPAGTTMLLVGGANTRFTPPRALTATTWNGAAMSNLDGAAAAITQITQSGGSDYIRLQWWWLASPTATTANAVGTWNGATRGSMVAIAVTGSVTTAPTWAGGSSNAQAITSGANDLVISLFATDEGDTTTIALSAPATSQFNFIGSPTVGGQSTRTGLATQAGTGGSTTTTWTPTGGFVAVAHLVLSIAGAGGGGGRTFQVLTGLDGISSSGPLQFNPSLGYSRIPPISMEAYRRERVRAHREFMEKVRRAA